MKLTGNRKNLYSLLLKSELICFTLLNFVCCGIVLKIIKCCQSLCGELCVRCLFFFFPSTTCFLMNHMLMAWQKYWCIERATLLIQYDIHGQRLRTYTHLCTYIHTYITYVCVHACIFSLLVHIYHMFVTHLYIKCVYICVFSVLVHVCHITSWNELIQEWLRPIDIGSG